MNLLEYQAKTLLANHGLPAPRSWLVRAGSSAPEDVVFPVVAKSQVPVGGRGKAGGVVNVDSVDELTGVLEKIFALDIKGHKPSAILLEEKIEVTHESYLAFRLNRDNRQVEVMSSPQGGVDIEDNTESLTTTPLDDSAPAIIMEALGVSGRQFESIFLGLADVFFKSDCTLLEINPFVTTQDGGFVIADAKITIDDNARFRHPELPWPPAEGNPPKPLGGTIGCIANGAGMAMSTMDTIVAAGGKPANFLDIGGGTGEKEFVTALKQIMELPNVTSIIVNIFAGISRCDEIARGIIAAREQLPGLPPLFIRLEGTNRDIAVELLTEADIDIEPDLKTCVQKAMEVRA